MSKARRDVFSVALAALALLALTCPLHAQESYTLGGGRVAVFNLAGEVRVVGGSGSQVTVEVTVGGRQGDQLRVEVGEVEGREALRVVYPDDRVVYSVGRWSGSAELQVRRDGTWGSSGRGLPGLGGQRVRISNRGSGLEAHADLRVTVPRGRAVDIYLAVGRMRAENVDGTVRLDTHSGAVEARDVAGELTIDTGSGSVDVEGMRGDLVIDTGSGGVRVVGVDGETVTIDTGSGSVVAEEVVADRVSIDTGSGAIDLLRSRAREVELDTGSGSVEAELAGDVDSVVVDTGSGGVTLRLSDEVGARLVVDTGSGGIDTDLPVTVSRSRRGRLEGQLGDGQGLIQVDVGSGSVRILRW